MGKDEEREELNEQGKERTAAWVRRRYPVPDFERIRAEREERLEEERQLEREGEAECQHCGAVFEVADVDVHYFILRRGDLGWVEIRPLICPQCSLEMAHAIDDWWRAGRRQELPEKAQAVWPIGSGRSIVM